MQAFRPTETPSPPRRSACAAVENRRHLLAHRTSVAFARFGSTFVSRVSRSAIARARNSSPADTSRAAMRSTAKPFCPSA